MKLALVDGDIVAYQASASANVVSYTTPDDVVFRYKKDAVQHCRTNELDEKDIKKTEELDPVEFAFANANRIINKIMSRTECEDYKVFISGDGNFRKGLSATYKAHRDDVAKPQYLEDVKDYLIKNHDAVVTHSDLEADDFIGMSANEDTVVCTLDKDLDQIVGWHYNWTKDHLYFINTEEAALWFWMQMLMGDRADNIEGIRGIGEKTAMKLLAYVPSNRLRCVVGLEYAKHFDDPEEVYRINSQLLWIQR